MDIENRPCECPDNVKKTASASSFSSKSSRKSKSINEDQHSIGSDFKDSFILKERTNIHVKPWQRLFYHQTSSSMRRNSTRNQKLGDELDFVLSSTYQHNEEIFPEKCDVYYQPITVEVVKRKTDPKKDYKLFKSVDLLPKGSGTDISIPTTARVLHGQQIFPDHPLMIGGITERIHPSSIKLMNSSHHSPQTNAGYVRQDRDGNLFQY